MYAGLPHGLGPPLQRTLHTLTTGWRSPLMGFVAPPSLRLSRVHSQTPAEASVLRRLVATRAVTFRPRGFSPPRRFPPRGGCGLVASRSRPGGSTRFSRSNEPPPRIATPFEVFPSPAAGPRHRGRCPLVVTWGRRTRSLASPGCPRAVRSLCAPPPTPARSPPLACRHAAPGALAVCRCPCRGRSAWHRRQTRRSGVSPSRGRTIRVRARGHPEGSP